MTRDRFEAGLTWTVALGVALLGGCGEPATAPTPTASPPAETPAAAASSSAGGIQVPLVQPDKSLPELDSCGALAESNDRCGPLTTLFPEAPGDVCRPDTPDWQPGPNAMDHLSWRTLVALLWPAKVGAPGEPDRSARPGARLDDTVSRPAVFETWASADDLTALAAGLAEGESLGPEDWGSHAPKPEACPSDSRLRVLQHVGKVRSATAQALEGTPAADAVGGPVVDQNGQVLFVETRFNRTMWDVITRGGYYREGSDRRGLSFPNDLGDTRYGQGAIAVQAAWTPLSDPAAKSGHFLVRLVLLHQEGTEDRPGTCDRQLVGLAGMAIAHKSTVGGEHWVWSAFDHRDAIPNDAVDLPQEYFLSSSACVKADTSTCASASTPADEKHACCPNHDLHGPLGPKEHILADRTPTQLAHVDPWQDDSQCGEQYTATLAGTPVAFFRLAGTQWWADADRETVEFGVRPRSLRTAVLLPWEVAPTRDGRQVATSSCIGCHQAGDDSMFLLRSLGSANVAPSEEPSAPE